MPIDVAQGNLSGTVGFCIASRCSAFAASVKDFVARLAARVLSAHSNFTRFCLDRLADCFSRPFMQKFKPVAVPPAAQHALPQPTLVVTPEHVAPQPFGTQTP